MKPCLIGSGLGSVRSGQSSGPRSGTCFVWYSQWSAQESVRSGKWFGAWSAQKSGIGLFGPANGLENSLANSDLSLFSLAKI